MQKRSNLLTCKSLWIASSIPILMLLFLTSVAYAEWYKDYDNGVKATSKGQWQEAVNKLQNAIKDRSNEAANLRFYGTRIDDYFPHFYLGLAYYNLKNYEAAANEFRASQQQGAINARPRLVDQLTNLQTLMRAQNATSKGGSTITEKPFESPSVVVPTPPQLAKEDTAKPSQGSVNQSPPGNAPVQQPKETPPQPKPEPPKFDVDGYKQSMRSGAQQYFVGDYDAAIHSFAAATNADPTKAGGFFYLGCSYASKYLLSGSQDRNLLDKAIYAFQQSRKIDPQYGLSNSYISPAVLEIFQKNAAS